MDRPALLAGRVAFITGAAGGICSAVAAAFVEHGVRRLILADEDQGRLDALIGRLDELGPSPDLVPLVIDVTSQDWTARALQSAGDDGVDILVNGVGHYLPAGPFLESTDDDWERLYRINLRHVLQACQAFAPGMRDRGWGRIINFSSVEGTLRAAPGLPVYAALKAAVDGFSKSLAVDLARHGVNVNAIAVDKTESLQVQFDVPEPFAHVVPTWTPAGRLGRPVDVAGVALFLASELSSWVVGSTLAADGGTAAAGGWYRTPERWTVMPMLLQYFEDPEVTRSRPRTLQ